MADNETVPLTQAHEPGMSVTIGKIASALSKFQAEVEQPQKTKTAKVRMRDNKGTYEYKYADLADCIKIAQPLLAKYELAVIQTVKTGKGFVCVKTTLAHSSGEYISDVVTLPVGDDKPQSYGSAITYARRYGYCAPLGISPDEDEDGNIAQDAKSGSQPNNQQPPKQQRQQPKQGGTPPPVKTTISEKQAKRMFAIQSQRGWTTQEVKHLLDKKYGFQSSKDITVLAYDNIIKDLETKTYAQVMGHLINPGYAEQQDLYPEPDPADEFPDYTGDEVPPWQE